MRRAKITIFHSDGSQEVVMSRPYEPSSGEYSDFVTAIGLHINLEDGSQIIVQPTLHKKIKKEYIDA